jgi:hypothetical protein
VCPEVYKAAIVHPVRIRSEGIHFSDKSIKCVMLRRTVFKECHGHFEMSKNEIFSF